MNRHRKQQEAPDLSDAARSNIQTIARMEQEFLKQRSVLDRIADLVAGFSGSIVFVIFHIFVFALWFIVNLGLIPGIRAFDPYPFILLGMVVSCEAVLLSTFVLMKQNRMSQRSEQRDHLHLQIALLAERELTKVLQHQQRLGAHLGLPELAADPEVQDLTRETEVEKLVQELKEELPTGSA